MLSWLRGFFAVRRQRVGDWGDVGRSGPFCFLRRLRDGGFSTAADVEEVVFEVAANPDAGTQDGDRQEASVVGQTSGEGKEPSTDSP